MVSVFLLPIFLILHQASFNIQKAIRNGRLSKKQIFDPGKSLICIWIDPRCRQHARGINTVFLPIWKIGPDL